LDFFIGAIELPPGLVAALLSLKSMSPRSWPVRTAADTSAGSDSTPGRHSDSENKPGRERAINSEFLISRSAAILLAGWVDCHNIDRGKNVNPFRFRAVTLTTPVYFPAWIMSIIRTDSEFRQASNSE
jgi:hypothetical protein